MFCILGRPTVARFALRARTFHPARHASARSCPSCHHPLSSSLPACTNCWNIFPLPSDVTHHQLFNLPYHPNPFSVNTALLKKRFREAQAVCHPDAWSSKGSHKEDVAQALSARLNGAYQSLLNPLSRAEYILERNQLGMSEADQVNDVAFMSHIMEAREVIEESEDENEIVRLAEENDAHIQETVGEIERLVGQQDWEGVKAATIRLRYLEGIERAAKRWMESHEALN
ncbi:hypothetical protein AX17_000044 [Amanita inopinata Kibby_2008]|nr:hypothetical protein AX17_000044 [Amanita inopinata Kibby_2008]